MDTEDPIYQFFPGQEQVDLYAVLALKQDATPDNIKKAYRRLALIHHPDKHANSSDDRKQVASQTFQQVGFAYAVLSDDKRRKRYDATGKTDEGFELAAGEDGWEAYFTELFDSVTRSKLDEMKKEYQGSAEELEDLKNAYIECEGNIEEIMTHVPHCTYEDEDRFVALVAQMLKRGEVASFPAWKASATDKKAKARRKKAGEAEAHEAEGLAVELGVWDEFYGDGKTGKRRAKGGPKDKAATAEDDTSALQALIQQRQKGRMDSLVDSLAAKYGGAEEKGKRRKRQADDASESRKKKTAPPPPDIDDTEFEKLQQQLFGGGKVASTAPAKTRSRPANGR